MQEVEVMVNVGDDGGDNVILVLLVKCFTKSNGSGRVYNKVRNDYIQIFQKSKNFNTVA